MVAPRRVVIAGAGLAGATAAATLRERDFDGEITLLGAEQRTPYELPPLSKAMLLGEQDEPDPVREPGFYRDFGIDLRTGTEAVSLRPDEGVVLDASGHSHGYDAAVLATGSRPRTLGVPGIAHRGIHTLRTAADSQALRAAFTPQARVVVVGAGWIGCEAAAAARTAGATVTVVDPLPAPLVDVLGTEVAGVFQGLHEQHGVTFRFGVAAEGFDGDDAAGGSVRSVQLDDGTEEPADVVVLAVGAEPRTDLAVAAGLELAEGGVAVDATLRTSAEGVYAIGDIAAQAHPRYGRRVRVEHWANAKGQGEHVAGVLLGEAGDYTEAPYFFTDQYDLGCEYRGLADPGHDELVVRGSLPDREFVAFWCRDGAVRAALNVNVWDDGDSLQALVDSGTVVSADALRTADLGSLVS